jgi:hypothetical protein
MSSDTCRHGLLTYLRDGEPFHRHDGSRCESTPPHGPDLLAYEREAERVDQHESVGDARSSPGESSVLTAPPVVVTERPEATSELFDEAETEPIDSPPTKRRFRPWRAAAVALGAVLLLAAGVGLGLNARHATIDRQKRRATAAENQVASLRDQVSRQRTTIDDQQRRLATSEAEQNRLKRQNAQLVTNTANRQPQAGPNATTFGDGLYQAGVAIQPGQYRTDGSNACYWAKLSTGDTNSVIENHLGSGPQTVTIDSPYFESENCGTWTKVA